MDFKKYENRQKVYTNAMIHFGMKKQMIVAIEELSELQKEVCKYLRNAGNYTPDPNPDFDLSHLVEEMADVTVMLEQLRLFLGVNDQVQEQVARKVERLDGRLKESGDWGG